MSKILRVCLFRELPDISNRNSSFIYFAYDKLMVFIGQNLYTDHYCIVEDIPENPINGMLYFLLSNGDTCIYQDYEVRIIAHIESQAQLNLLKQCGTTFFFNADRRYLDMQRRLITLPYKNGTYELSVSIANELMIDQDTVIGFNTDTNEFEIIGNRQQYLLDFDPGYKAVDTDSVKTTSEDHYLKSKLKISPAYDNMIRLINNGVYVSGSGKVSKAEFEQFRAFYQDLKASLEGFLETLADEIDDAQDIVSPEAISRRIFDTLEPIIPEIENDLALYDELYERVVNLEVSSKQYTDQQFQNAYNELYTAIVDATNNPWEDLS